MGSIAFASRFLFGRLIRTFDRSLNRYSLGQSLFSRLRDCYRPPCSVG